MATAFSALAFSAQPDSSQLLLQEQVVFEEATMVSSAMRLLPHHRHRHRRRPKEARQRQQQREDHPAGHQKALEPKLLVMTEVSRLEPP